MTDQQDTPTTPPIVRNLFDGVDALMRRNRRTGTVEPPPPPPEGLPDLAKVSAEIFAEVSAKAFAGSFGKGREEENAEPLPTVRAESVKAHSDTPLALRQAQGERNQPASSETPTVAQAPESVPEVAAKKARAEDDLLLWEFALPIEGATPEPEAPSAEVEEAKPAVKEEPEEPRTLEELFFDALSLMSTPEVLATPAQGSVSYETAPPTVAFDVAAPEASETKPASTASEEEVWLPSAETDDIPPALDEGSAIGVAEALAPLSGIGLTEAEAAAEEAAKGATDFAWPEPKAELLETAAPETPEVETAEAETIEAPEEIAEAVEAEAVEEPEEIVAEELEGFTEAPEDEFAEAETAEASEVETAEPGEALFAEPLIFAPEAVEEETAGEAGEAAAEAVTEPPEEQPAEEQFAPEKPAAPSFSAAALLSEFQYGNEVGTPPSHYSAAQLLSEYQQQHPQVQNIKAMVVSLPPIRTTSSVDEHDSLLTLVESAKDGNKTKTVEKAPEKEPPKVFEKAPENAPEKTPDKAPARVSPLPEAPVAATPELTLKVFPAAPAAVARTGEVAVPVAPAARKPTTAPVAAPTAIPVTAPAARPTPVVDKPVADRPIPAVAKPVVAPAAPAVAPNHDDDYFPVLTDVVSEEELPSSGRM
ncbi:MAG: hypothetical protein FWF41_02865 [Betaproteobacteria bacterium]|nr:hypothetical protein [Betaproteobacteria bacterium]